MNILLQWATGLGKTKAALDYVKQTILKQPKVLILVAEIAHIQNWKDEITKWKCKTVMSKSTFCCYSSLHKMTSQKWDFIICDECHHVFSEKRIKSFQELQYTNIILLSATLTENNIYILQSLVSDLIIDTQSLKNCINDGKLVMPEIKIVKKIFSTYEDCQYVKLCNKYEYAKNLGNNNMQKFAAINRKKFVANSKTNVLRGIIKKLRIMNKKFVCYCASIQQMEDVSNKQNCISSKHKGSIEIINKFNNNTLNELFFCQMGIEGLNLQGIEVVVICQADANTRSFIQKIGRVLRNKVNPEVYIVEAIKSTKAKTIDNKWITDCLIELK